MDGSGAKVPCTPSETALPGPAAGAAGAGQKAANATNCNNISKKALTFLGI
jgi:hypothetical protein